MQLSSTETDDSQDYSVSEIEENQPNYEARVLPKGEKITDEEKLKRTEKKLSEIVAD